MIKAVIVDCFGVIITDSLQLMCEELRSRDPAAADDVRDLVRANNLGMVDPHESNQQIATIFGLTYEVYRQKVADGEAKDQTLLDYIVTLRLQYKTALLSNIGVGSLAKRFEVGELERYFDIVVASGEIGYAKPEPEAYEIAAERLGVRLDECLFTDDRAVFCEAAQSCGMQAIVYENFAQFKTELEKLLSQS